MKFKFRKKRPLDAIALCAFLLICGSAIFVTVHYIKINKTSLEVTRLFLRLERAIGYSGFIHNFKNYILRPGEPNYAQRALENYQEAQETFDAIAVAVKKIDLQASLKPSEETLKQYRIMMDKVRELRATGASITEVDDFIRISDAKAARSFHIFEDNVATILSNQYRTYNELLILAITGFILSLTLLLFVQSARRRQIEAYNKRLLRHERRMQNVEWMAKLGHWESDFNGNLSWSELMFKICGISSDEFPGTNQFFWELVHPEDHAKLQTAVKRAISRETQYICIHRLVRPDGKIMSVCNSGHIVRDSSGTPTGLAGTLQDVTLILKMESKLRQAQKLEAIGVLASGLAHDFNNLMTVIQGNIEVTMGADLPPACQKNLEAVLSATKRGATLTRSMLSYARKAPILPTKIDLNQLIKENQNWAANLVPDNVQFSMQLMDDIWSIKTDPNLVQSALLNLFLNARDAMPEGGELIIATKNVQISEVTQHVGDNKLVPGDYVQVSVRDTGTGIPDDILSKIFDPFYTTKPAGSGSGLGLSMVLGLMEQIDGAVAIHTTPNEGTEFKLYFKASSQEAAANSIDSPPPIKMLNASTRN